MKHHSRIALTLIVAVAAVFASPLPGAERPFLWEVTAEGGRAYLLGSLHLATEDLYPLDPAIEAAFDQSETLVVEVDINSVNPLALQQKMMAAGMAGEGQRLSEALPPETLEKLQAFVAERRVPFQMFDVMKPWLGSMMITVLELQRLGYDPRLGIDKHFLDKAKERGMAVESLESAEFQIDLLSSFADDMQDDLLEYTLDYLDEIPEMIGTLVAAWKSGDGAAMERLVLSEEGLREFPAVYDKMFFERNKAMSAKIAQRLEAGGTWFVVVGSGHLVGEGGITELLGRDERFEVRQVEAAAAVSAR